MTPSTTRPISLLHADSRRACKEALKQKIRVAFRMATTPACERSNILDMQRGYIEAERLRRKQGDCPLEIKTEVATDLVSFPVHD